jgi:hypothetical protein
MLIIKQNALLNCLDCHIRKNHAIIQKLDDLSDEMFQHNKDVKVSKAAATGAALIGTGVALAPITSGLTLGIGLGIIGGTIAGGAAVSIHSNIKDKQKTKKTILKIQTLVSSREDILEEEYRISNNLRECVDVLVMNGRSSKEEAIRKVLLAHSKGPIEVREGESDILITSDSNSIIPINLSLLHSGSALNDYFKEDDLLFRQDMIDKSKNINLISNSIVSVLNFGSEIAHTFITPLIYFLFPAVIFASIANVALLVKNWDEVHPTVEHIVEVKQCLLNEIEKCKKFKSIFERFIAEENARKIDCLEEILETQNESMCETKNKILKLEEECKNSKEILRSFLDKINLLEKQSANKK